MKGNPNTIRVQIDTQLDNMWTWTERQQQIDQARQAAAKIYGFAGYNFDASKLMVGLSCADTQKSHIPGHRTVFFHITWADGGSNTDRSNRNCKILRAEVPKKKGGYNYHCYHGWERIKQRMNKDTLKEIVRKPLKS